MPAKNNARGRKNYQNGKKNQSVKDKNRKNHDDDTSSSSSDSDSDTDGDEPYNMKKFKIKEHNVEHLLENFRNSGFGKFGYAALEIIQGHLMKDPKPERPKPNEDGSYEEGALHTWEVETKSWKARMRDFERLIEFQNYGDIYRIYTQKMRLDLLSDLIQIKAELDL